MRKKFRVVVDGEEYEVEVEVVEGESDLDLLRRVFSSGEVRRVSPSPGSVQAPISGKVVRVGVSAGDRVGEGDVVAVLEAMKSLVEVRAPFPGVVEEVFVREGDLVRQGDPIVRIGRAEAPGV